MTVFIGKRVKASAVQNNEALVALFIEKARLVSTLPGLVKGYAPDKAQAFAEKIIPFSQFMNQVAGVDQMSGQGRKIAFHSPCHLGRGLGVKEDPRHLIARSGNIYIKTREEDVC